MPSLSKLAILSLMCAGSVFAAPASTASTTVSGTLQLNLFVDAVLPPICLNAVGEIIGDCSDIFEVTTSSSTITITSAAGPCGLVNSILTCGANVAPANFSNVQDSDTLGSSCLGIGGKIWDTFGDPADFLAIAATASSGNTCLFLVPSS